MSDLITVAEYKNAAGINSTNSDPVIISLVPKVSAFIKNYCNRGLIDYSTVDKTEIATVAYSDVIYLREVPIISITSVSESNDYGQTYTALAQYSEYVVDSEADAIVRVGGNFSTTRNGVKIIYKGGYTETPEPLKQGAIELVTYFLRNESTPRRSTTSSNLAIEYITSSNLPAHIRQLLDGYRYVNI